MKQKLADLLVFCLIFSGLLMSFIFTHEFTHMYIYEDAGCNNVEINMPWNVDKQGAFMTTSAHCSHLPQEELESLTGKQDMVEIVGYQLLPIHFVLTGFFLVFLYENKGKREGKRLRE